MAKRKHLSVMIAVLALVLMIMTVASGCGGRNSSSEPAEPVSNTDPVTVSEPVESSASETGSGRQDGERFEDVIILEGMEETVSYEHVRNDAIGFEMDYDYTRFVRNSEPDRECFVSCYDLADSPENYLEVTYSPETAETVAANIGEDEYDILRNDSFTLARAGSCIRIDASNGKGNTGTPDQLQMVYIIPASDGCRVATAHYSWESAEGFGRRFHYFMDTLSVIDAQG